jgi:23S rRNA (uracil1939-C5)-methyltransferase
MSKDRFMTFQKGQLLELEISETAFGGKGLARADGLVVFIENAVPRDRVTARIIKRNKNFAEARMVDILKPSPFRIKAPCAYSGYCGGCKWQFLTYDKQLEYKRQHVIDCLEHIGLIKEIDVRPAIPSALMFGYRNKMEFSCSERRWLPPDEMGREDVDNSFALGLHVPGTFQKVLDIQKCLLQPATGNDILNEVARFIKNSSAPVYGLRSHSGFWRFLVLRHSVAYDRWMVNIVTASEDRTQVQPLADLLREKYPAIISMINNITSRKAGIAVGEYEILLSGDSCLRDRIGRYEFEISANSFFQTNTRSAERLYETVKEYARLSGKEIIVDLYSGTGTIPIWLSDAAKEVVGIEIVESAVADARKNCALNKISNCRFIQGDIRNCLSQVKAKPDVMVIDPPRSGMHKDVVKMVLETAPHRMVYVSCNPGTMARDLGMIKDHYRVLEVQPVDMFPHTWHIESVARLERNS